MEELLSLKWNNHRSTFLHILAVLRDKQLYTDATLACDGKLYSVHKLVLSTCSDYFSSMLDRTSCKSPVIVLKDIKCEDLEALLDYMYLGEVNVRQSDLATLIKAAECLRVKGLAVPDDEPPPRKTRAAENQSRRGDTSGSPPAKRKRRSDVEDGREDVRPVKTDNRQSSPVHSSSRPKSPLSNNSNHSTSSRTNSAANAQVTNNGTSNNTASTTASAAASRQSTESNAGAGDDYIESAPYVKVEMEEDDTGGGGADGSTGEGGAGGGDSSNAADMGDSYNMSNDDFKEEDDNDGGDMGGDLPEFLQQAAGNYPHSSFAGPSFQPDVSWQGGDGSGGLAGSFAAAAAGLSFGGQQDGGHNTSAGGGGSGSDAGREHYCPTCGKLFNGRNWKQNLEYHMFKHTGLKPFRCPFCRHSSALKFNLLRHIKNKHAELIALGMLPDQHMLHKQLQQQHELMAMVIQPSDDLLLSPASINRNCHQLPQQQHHELNNLSAQLKESLLGVSYLGGAASSSAPPLQELQSPTLPQPTLQTSPFQQMFGNGSQTLLPSESFAVSKPLFNTSAALGDGGSHDISSIDAAANYSGGCDVIQSSTDETG